MNLYITIPEDIYKELCDIQSFLDITPSDDSAEVVNRGNELSAYISRSGKLLADSKYWLNEKMNSEIIRTFKETTKIDKMSNTAINELIKSLCREEHYLVDWSERINRCAVHQIEFCRSILSKNKAEMSNFGYGNRQ